MKKAIALVLATVTSLSCAAAAEISNKDVAEALASIIEAEKSTYSKLIEDRADAHGCKIAKDLAAMKAEDASLPKVSDFQTMVMTAVTTRDEGKFANAADVPALAAKAGGMSIEEAADLLHAYAAESRTNYTKQVISRAIKSSCSKPSEEWSEENGLPLPAQFTRATAEAARKIGKLFYALQSEWPINKQNAPKTDFEKNALEAVKTLKPVYGEETLGGKSYFSAVYADVAVDGACIACHNGHAESPKKDFKLNDVMGAMVLRIPR